MGQIEVFSPAKINLFLSVVGRMESGFHELVSLVAPVDFGDELTIAIQTGAPSRAVALVCSDASLPTDERNLAFAAARRFLDAFDLDWEVSIRLEKRIPHGAGLGGGSSNAAAMMRMMRMPVSMVARVNGRRRAPFRRALGPTASLACRWPGRKCRRDR